MPYAPPQIVEVLEKLHRHFFDRSEIDGGILVRHVVVRARDYAALNLLLSDDYEAVNFRGIVSTKLSHYFETVAGRQRDVFKCHCRL
jgi:hypothetical protein